MKPSLLYFLSIIILWSCNHSDEKKKEDVNVLPPYDEKTACLLSQVSYCTNEQKALDTYLPGWKLVWESSELGGNHAIVTTNDTAYALSIRGSLMDFSWSAFQNWIYQDLNVASQQKWIYTNDSSKAKLAQGSWDGWVNLCKMTDHSNGTTLISFLEDKIKPNTPFLITGHSLGGNLATVYASWLWQYFHNNDQPKKLINVITFAAPAAGNTAFANDFNKKFPHSLRFENTNDIVPKFPCVAKVAALGDLYTGSLSAGKVMVGYKSLTVSLSKVFNILNTALMMLEFTNACSYTQTNGEGKLITIPLSEKNTGEDIGSWLNEAGYHHGIARYAAFLGVPVIECQ